MAIRTLDERLQAIQAVTPEDVQRVVAVYLVQEKRSVVHVVPPDVEQVQSPPDRPTEGGDRSS